MSSLSGTPSQALAGAESQDSIRQQELLKKAQQGDRPAYGQLVLEYQHRLYNAVLRVIGDPEEARELTQDAFTRGLLKIETFRGNASPYTWLFRIAINLAISRLRKVQRKRVFSLSSSTSSTETGGANQATPLVDRLAGTSPDPATVIENRERDQKVLEALGRLDAEFRAVLVMRDIEGFEYQEMADILGMNLGTLKSRLFRARLALRDELRVYMGDPRRSESARDGSKSV